MCLTKAAELPASSRVHALPKWKTKTKQRGDTVKREEENEEAVHPIILTPTHLCTFKGRHNYSFEYLAS